MPVWKEHIFEAFKNVFSTILKFLRNNLIMSESGTESYMRMIRNKQLHALHKSNHHKYNNNNCTSAEIEFSWEKYEHKI